MPRSQAPAGVPVFPVSPPRPRPRRLSSPRLRCPASCRSRSDGGRARGSFCPCCFASAERKDNFLIISAFNGTGKAHFLPRAKYIASFTVLPLPVPKRQASPGSDAARAAAPQPLGHAAARERVASTPGTRPTPVPVPRGTTSRTTLLRGVSFLRTAACDPGSAGSGTCPAPWLSLPTHTFTFSALPPQPSPFPNPLPALPAGLAYPRRGSGASTDLSLQ